MGKGSCDQELKTAASVQVGSPERLARVMLICYSAKPIHDALHILSLITQ